MKQVTLLALLNLIHFSVFADDAETFGNRLEIGIGSVLQNSVYTDEEPSALVFPMFVAKYKNLYVKGGKAGFIFYGLKKSNTVFWTEVIANARLQGITSASGSLEGLTDRKNTLDMGLEASIASDDWGMINFSMVHDVLNVHQGYELAIKYQYPMSNGPWFLMPSIGIHYMNQDLADYYFGVDINEVKLNRSQYTVNEAINLSAGYELQYRFNEKWSILNTLNLMKLDRKITDSPIVSNNLDIIGIVGLVYSF